MRTLFSIAVALLVSCGSRPAAQPLTAPAELPGGWRLEGSADLPSAEAPQLVRSLSLKRALRARYQGPASLTVTFFEMTTAPAAFELVQKWRPAPGTLFLHHKAWFLLIESPGSSNAALSQVATALEAHLKQ